MNSQSIHLRAIGVTQSCFTEKFGIPRQPGLAPSARARICIFPEFAQRDAFEGLEQCSHIWLQFIFHESPTEWKNKVRPPRLGGNRRLGVFATRSPNRPNPLGLSVVRFLGIEQNSEGLFVNIGGADLLNGTPIVDIKPYVPYVDAVADAVNQIAPAAPVAHPVIFSAEALASCEVFDRAYSANTIAPANLRTLITEVLQQDPRPQYQTADTGRIYGMTLFDANIRWRYKVNPDGAAAHTPCCIEVLDINMPQN